MSDEMKMTPIDRQVEQVQAAIAAYKSVRHLSNFARIGSHYEEIEAILADHKARGEEITRLTARVQELETSRKPAIRVAAAVIEDQGLVRIFKRGGSDSYTGKWEFPGGKANPEESLRDALRRELREELAVDSEIGEELDHYWYRYPNREPISLTFFAVKLLQSPELLEHTESAWVKPRQLVEYDLMNGDIQFVATRYVLAAERDRLKAELAARKLSHPLSCIAKLEAENKALRAFAQDVIPVHLIMVSGRIFEAAIRSGLATREKDGRHKLTPLLTGEAEEDSREVTG